MVIVSRTVINNFAKRHADSLKPLNQWYKDVTHADWNSFADLKKDFASADYVGDNRYVFNIKGNHYRLVALIFFDKRTLYIRFIGTHADYDKIDCETI